jgi:hypothetical protein
MADYDGSESGLVVEPSLAAFMQSTLDKYLARVQLIFPPEDAVKPSVEQPSVFTGSGGRALIYLRQYQFTGVAEYLATAQQYVDGALANIQQIDEKFCGFNWGRTGVYCVAAAIYDALGDAEKVQEMMGHVQSVFASAVDDSRCPYDDWDSGRGGLLYAADFLQRNLIEYKTSSEPAIPRGMVAAVGLAIVDRGARVSREPGQYLEWISPNDGEIWIDNSQGSCGVLHGLLAVPEVVQANATARALVIGTLNHIVAMQQPSGNFPTEYFSPEDDELVQWDHGAPGMMPTLVEAALVYAGDESSDPPADAAGWVAAALRAADCTWERGLLTKGLQLCHGISGNTYMQLHLASRLQALAASPFAAELGLPGFDPSRYVFRALQVISLLPHLRTDTHSAIL